MKKDRLDYEFLPEAAEIEETPPSPLGRILLWAIVLLMVAAFAWSYFGKVDEEVVARGKVVPDGMVKVIQPRETGVIRAIHVMEGQKVRKGDLLIELDPTMSQAEVESSERSLKINRYEMERLKAELKGEEIDGAGKNPDKLLLLQKSLKQAREEEHRAKVASLELVISQKRTALLASEESIAKLERALELVAKQEEALRQLAEKGYASMMEHLQRQKELVRTEKELNEQRKLSEQIRDSLKEAERNLEALKKERERSILGEILEKERSITVLEGEFTKASKRSQLEKLHSPVNGTVHGLAMHTIGGVVTSAQPIVTIVPEGTPMIVEAMALNKDVGFIHLGQKAELKLDTFPFQKYGTIEAELFFVSPDAQEDQKIGLVYKIKLRPNRLMIRVKDKDIPLSPGMAVTAEIKTGERRVIEFFISPFIKHVDESLTLR
ncbi:MAG: HlyD family type I secretion periplasmic adaptor subunit [Deltaproteobacteria bacterium]|nr:HlyD family type I secretion periplasmic adaptor subunit [Deltaproteobacteria bacterium]MBM4322812.1 HlyD family type I secretion periplasmic adaptor subunit [Deltaproteobacteria bacterium]